MIREVYKLQQFLTQLDQRETVADRLDEMLGKWVESIPESYRGDTLPGFGPVQLRYFKQLRVTYYHCIFSILQAALRSKDSTLATQAAMTILAANNITLSEHNLHDPIAKDQETLHVAHGEVSDLLDEDLMGEVVKSCGELIIKARESVQQFNESKSMEDSGDT
ncbi:hypothetical protein H9L39_06396 [Fusarium oxysporum f. sp. albedinis]|nr:hypothetical protein H9L39_06396 [Fusarium oxysporum f. sp. albedinis]